MASFFQGSEGESTGGTATCVLTCTLGSFVTGREQYPHICQDLNLALIKLHCVIAKTKAYLLIFNRTRV